MQYFVRNFLIFSQKTFYHKLYLARFDKYIKTILSLFLVNDPQALYVNPGCLNCISGIYLSPANENLLTISFNLYLVLTYLILLKEIKAY